MQNQLTGAQTALIAAATQGEDAEWRGYAEEMACQYGAEYLDDDATVLRMRTTDLVNMMAVLGYRKPDKDAEIAAMKEALQDVEALGLLPPSLLLKVRKALAQAAQG